MAFTVGTIQASVPTLMAGRAFSNADIAEACRKAILELSEDYKFPLLQTTGPIVQLIPLHNQYSPNYFMIAGSPPAGDQGLEINKVNSFFFYYNQFVPLVGASGSNPGYQLTFSTVDDIEILTNTIGPCQYWSRYGDQIILAMTPDLPYFIAMRYQKEHPFPNAGTVTANIDPILLPNSWQDIVEYATAQRLANNTRLFDIANAMKTNLYGDPLFQRSGGTEGTPGLIFHRTSQEQRDQTTSVKSMRLRMRPIMR